MVEGPAQHAEDKGTLQNARMDGEASPARLVLSSGAPALLWAAIGCPFDMIKTRLQTAKTPFTSPVHCLAWTVRREGLAALWKGLVPQLLVTTPYSVIMFSTYQALRPDTGGEGAGHLAKCFLAGAASGIAVTAVHNPLELWRVRLQTHLPLASDGSTSSGSSRKAKVRTSSTVLLSLLTHPRQLGRGASMTLAENVIGNGAFFCSNEALRRVSGRQTWASELLVGGLTGVVFQAVVYPMDLVKARLMTQDGLHAAQAVRQVLGTDGISGFYRGASVAVLRAFAINAAGWPALRAAQLWLGVTAE